MKRLKDLFKKIKSSKRLRAVLIVTLAVIVAVSGFSIWRSKASQKNASGSEQRTATAVNGDLLITLTGSGAVSAGQRKEIQNQLAGTVNENDLQEGKAVKAGDPLVKLESTDAEINLEKMENAVKQKQLAADQQQEQLAGLSVSAPISGRIGGLALKEGDNVNKGQVICSIADESTLQLRAQFKGIASGQLANAKSVQVNIPDFSVTLDAKTVSLVQSGKDTEAVLSIKNPGALTSGLSANAEIISASGDFISDQGSLEWSNRETVKAAASGTISDISALESQYVNQGKVILTIENDELATSVESAKLDLDQAEKDLEQAKTSMEEYAIKAPFDGILVSVADLSTGDNLKAGTTLATLIDTTQMTMQINIDELDISQVKPDQDVKITLDALEETAADPIAGKVTAVAVEGTSSNGVTSYPVTISFPGRDGLKVGMNADAEIQVLNKPNVLLVPFEAVQKRGNSYFVYLKTGDASNSGAADATNTSGAANNPRTGRRGQGAMSQLTPEQQQQLQNMTPEERQKLRDQYLQQNGGTEGQNGNASDQNKAGGQNGSAGSPVGGASGQSDNSTGQSGGGNTASSGTSASPSSGSAGNSTGTSGKTGRSSNTNGYAKIQNPYYSGTTMVPVTVGDHNENFIEITNGLKAGDVVVLPQITASSSSSSTTNLKQGASVMGMPVGGGPAIIQQSGGNAQYRRGDD